MSQRSLPKRLEPRSRVRQAAYPDRCTSGLLGGSSVEILPAKRACGGVCAGDEACASPSAGDDDPGRCVREALLKPPMSASLMTLHVGRADSSSKRTKGKGWLGLCRPSRRTAILDWRLSSSRERFQKPGGPLAARRMGVANMVIGLQCVRIWCGVSRAMFRRAAIRSRACEDDSSLESEFTW